MFENILVIISEPIVELFRFYRIDRKNTFCSDFIEVDVIRFEDGTTISKASLVMPAAGFVPAKV